MQNTKNLLSINNTKERTIRTESQEEYEHYIAIDWSQTNMAIARMSKSSKGKIKITECPTSIKRLKEQLESLRGSKILTIEESSPAHWLYVELHDCVEKIIICDPYKNRLLGDGAKNDPIDAKKLCLLLKGGLLHGVFHTTENIYKLRKLVSSYEDIISQSVRLKNQRAGFLAQNGKSKKTKELPKETIEKLIQESQDKLINGYTEVKKKYLEEISTFCKRDKRLRFMKTIPGIGEILAVKILAMTVDPKRFKNTGKYLAYCGLVKHAKESGGRIYGRRNTRYSRVLKSAYKTAALAAIGGNNPVREYYEVLIKNGLAEYNARHTIARYIARLCFGIMKNPGKYEPYLWRKNRCEK
ncbi:MAG: transposase [Ignavibacteriaceae bacterium]